MTHSWRGYSIVIPCHMDMLKYLQMMKKACKNKMRSSKQVGRSKIFSAELCFLSSLK